MLVRTNIPAYPQPTTLGRRRAMARHAGRGMGVYLVAPWVKTSGLGRARVKYLRGLGFCVTDPDTGAIVTCDDSTDTSTLPDASSPFPASGPVPGVPQTTVTLPDTPTVIVSGPPGTRPTVSSSNPGITSLINSIINAGTSAIIAATKPSTVSKTPLLTTAQAQHIIAAQNAAGGSFPGAPAPGAGSTLFASLQNWAGQELIKGTGISNGLAVGAGFGLLLLAGVSKARR